jgi:hypothetical protein
MYLTVLLDNKVKVENLAIIKTCVLIYLLCYALMHQMTILDDKVKLKI